MAYHNPNRNVEGMCSLTLRRVRRAADIGPRAKRVKGRLYFLGGRSKI